MGGVLLAGLSSLVWGCSDFLGGVLSRRLPSVAVLAWSQAAALVLMVVAVVLRGGVGGPADWVPWAVFAALTGATGLASFYTALATGTVGVVAPIAALGVVVPVAVGVASGDRPSGWQVLGMVLGICGAVAAGGPEVSRGAAGTARSVHRRSVLLALVAAVFYGASMVGIQRGAQTSALLTTFGMRLTSVTVFVVLALVLRSVGGVRPRDLPVLALLGVMDVAGVLLFGLAGTRGLPSVVAVLAAVYPVVTVLLGTVLLRERLSRVQAAGVLVTLAGVALLAAG